MIILFLFLSKFAEEIEVAVSSEGNKSFGWRFIGGNNIGIFVESVTEDSPAAQASIEVGWRLVEVKVNQKTISVFQ